MAEKRILCGIFLLALLAGVGCGKTEEIDDYATNAGYEITTEEAGESNSEETEEETDDATVGIPKDEVKVGVLHLADPAEGSGYTYTHDLGIQGMQANLGLSDDQIIRKLNVAEDKESTEKALQECVDKENAAPVEGGQTALIGGVSHVGSIPFQRVAVKFSPPLPWLEL